MSTEAAWPGRPVKGPYLVCLGGGELGQQETLPLDILAVSLAARHPARALFLGTASDDPPGYFEAFARVYRDLLGCRVAELRVAGRDPERGEVEAAFDGIDLVYAGGGSSLFMMERWRATGIDRALVSAAARGVVLAGLSAGALGWCGVGHTPVGLGEGVGKSGVAGIGLLPVAMAPHSAAQAFRVPGLAKLVARTGLVGVALDDHAALVVAGDRYRVTASRPGHRARRLVPDPSTRDGRGLPFVKVEEHPCHREWRSLATLLGVPLL